MSWYRIALVTALIAVVTLPAGLLSGLFFGGVTGFAVLVVGWFLLVPAIPLLYALYRTRKSGTTETEANENEQRALTELKQQYAAGEIDETTFEARAERLLELDAIERDDIDAITLDDQSQKPRETGQFEQERTNH